MTQNGSFKNISSVKSDFLKSYITFYLMSCNTEKKRQKTRYDFCIWRSKNSKQGIKKPLKSTKSVPVQIQRERKTAL